MSRLVTKFRHLLGRSGRMRRLEEEMATHLELLTEEGVRQGLPRDEARRRAHLAFGNRLATREETEATLGWPEVEALWLDLRIALRSLARRPAFALSLMLILAFGLGVTAAIFTLVRGMLWQPLPVPRPQELYLAYSQKATHRPFRLGAPTVHRMEADPALAGRVIAYASNEQLALRQGDAPAEPVVAQFVSGGFFPGLQLAAAQGRLLTGSDDELGRPRPVAVASWTWWRNKLGADPAAVGRTIRLNGQEVTIVGIAPPDFTGVSLGRSPELWLPKGLHAGLRVALSASISSKGEPPTLADWVRDDRVSWLNVLVRVGPGGTVAAQAAVDAAWRPQLATLMDNLDDADERTALARVRPILEARPQGYSSTRNNFRGAGFTLSLLVAAMLCVTVANISTLLLLRLLGPNQAQVVVQASMDFTRTEKVDMTSKEAATTEAKKDMFKWDSASNENQMTAEYLLPGFPSVVSPSDKPENTTYQKQMLYPASFVKKLVVTVILNKELPDQEDQAVRDVVKEILSMDEARGDALVIVKTPFAPFWRTIWYTPESMGLVFKYGILTLMGIVAMMVVATSPRVTGAVT